MARVCEICGKGRSLGNSVETRGKAKYLGGVGTKITGITRRVFHPNLQNVRTTTLNGTAKTVRVCAQCIRSGAIRKQIRNAPFKVAHDTATLPTGTLSTGKAAPTGKVAGGKAVAKKTVTKTVEKPTDGKPSDKKTVGKKPATVKTTSKK